MARKAKTPVTPVTPEAQAPEAQAPEAQAPEAQAPEAQAPAPVVVAGETVTLTKSQTALMGVKHGGRVLPGQYALGGKEYKVRSATNLAQWNAVLTAIRKGGGAATVPAIVEEGFPLTLAAPFVAYATARGWLRQVA
jgi:hypothetical protein